MRTSNWSRTVAAPVLLAGLAGCACMLAACGGGNKAGIAPSGAIVVAVVGDRSITRPALDAYLALAVGSEAEPQASDTTVSSRLLDQMIDEEMILAEAARRGITLGEEEKRGQLPSGAQGGDSAGLERVLLQGKFKREVILDGVTVSQDEVAAYFAAHQPEFREPAQVVLKKILLDDRKTAEQVRAQVAARPSSFEEVAEARSLAPGGGLPEAHEEDLLPEALRAQVQKLRPGELSPVVTDPQGFYILRLEGRQAASMPTLEELRERIELKLLTERAETRYQEFLAALRGSTRVEIREDQLPFAYVRKP